MKKQVLHNSSLQLEPNVKDPIKKLAQPDLIGKTEKPAHWNQMTAAAKSNWNKRNK